MKAGLHNVFSGDHSLTMEVKIVAETLAIYSVLIREDLLHSVVTQTQISH